MRPALSTTRRPRLGSALTALALAASLTACSGDDAPELSAQDASASPGVPTAPSAAATPSAAAAPTTPAPSRGPSPEPTDGATASAAALPGAPAPAAATAAPASAPASAPAARAAAPAPARATAAGSYTYDARGTATVGGAAPQSRSGTATLRVDAPEGDRQSAVLQGDQGRTETDALLRGDGRYLARLLLTTPAFSKEFAPASPVLLLPEPLTVGRTWSFTVTSTDGKTTATARNRVLRAATATIGGQRLETRVVESRLSLRGDVVYDGTTTTDYAPSVRLAVRERGSGKGTVNSLPFSTETTTTLRSTRPAA